MWTLSGRTGSALVWHTRGSVFEPACSKSSDLQTVLTPCNTWSSEGTAHEGGGCDQSIGSTVSDAIVRCRLWSTALGVPHWATSVDYCKQLIIDPTFCGRRFSTGRLLATEDFTFKEINIVQKVSPLSDKINFCTTPREEDQTTKI